VIVLTFRDYGITWDEAGQQHYGELLVRLYASGFRDREAFSYVDFFLYGGAFELPAAALARLSPLGIFETRHLLGAIVGLLGIAIVWRLARRLAGPGAGLLAVLLLAATPAWYGHMFVNPKDIPFATGMAGTLALICRAHEEWPRPRRWTVAGLGLAWGLALGTRIGGVLALPALLAPLAVRLTWSWRRLGPRIARRELSAGCARLAPALPLAYTIMAAAWPWAALDWANPLRALAVFSRYPFPGSVLFDGHLVPAAGLPIRYVPELLLLTTPEVLLVGVALAAGIGCAAVRHGGLDRLAEPRGRAWTAVAIAAMLPVVYAVMFRPVLYNGLRHFLFVLPPLAVLAAAGLQAMLLRGSGPAQAACMAAAGAGLLLPVAHMVALHPAQYAYFNQLAGGTRGALGRYQLDYWGVSLREATLELRQRLEAAGLPGSGRRLRVVVCANATSAAYYFPPYLELTDDPGRADLEIGLAEFYCPMGRSGRRILEVAREGAALAYVSDQHPETGRLAAIWHPIGPSAPAPRALASSSSERLIRGQTIERMLDLP
jgi:hypothetical protein